MRVEREQLIEALRLRYDHHSAHAMLAAAADRAGLPEAASYDAAQVQAWRAALARLGDRLSAVEARLDALVGAAPPAPTPAAPVATPAAVASAPAPAAAPPVPVAAPAPAPHPAVIPPAPVTALVAPIETTIALTGVEVDDGDQVLVCGGREALGDWDAERALPMVRRGDAWLATLELVPGTEVAFKFLQRRADGEVIWEDGDNRTEVAAPRIDAVWR